MLEEIDQEILNEFIKETLEELDGLDAQFIALEKQPKDSDVINSIFRAVHSIKGSSSFFSLDHIRSFAHKFENLLDELRKGQRSISREIIDLLLKGKDCLHSMFDRLAAGNLEISYLTEEQQTLTEVEQVLGEKEAEKPALEEIFLKISDLIAILEKEEISKNSTVADLIALVEELRSAALGPDIAGEAKPQKMGEILVETGKVAPEDVSEALSEQKKLGEILVEKEKVSPSDIDAAYKEQEKQSKNLDKARESAGKPGLAKSMRIEEEKIDGFMDLVGELIINSEVFNYLQKKLESGHDLDKTTMEFKNANVDFNELTLKLQKGLAEVRKVPIKGIFQKLPRMVRDLAAQIGKEVDFTMTGEDLLIDKSLLEQLESPIVHIIRNAVDHGVETPEDRKKAGKDLVGKIKAEAELATGDLVIHIIDDGKGVNSKKIKNKAIEKNLITAADAKSMTDKEAYKLLFAPGFSTAAKVTDVSGRGVGMDVVMTMVKEAKGKVDIEAEEGKGMHLTISVPMASTLITISGFLVQVGSEQYIIPMENVKESLKPVEKQIFTVKKSGEVVKIRDLLYPLLRLHEIFGVEPIHRDPQSAVVMVIEKEDRRCCLLVDQILDETHAVLKDLGEAFREVTGVMGGAILGDGKIGLVLDVEGLMVEHARIKETSGEKNV